MKFSLCVPNYNYARYVGETLQSVLRQQDPPDLEILVSDNASTDDSVGVVKALGDPRIRVEVQPWNVGFAGNLDRAAANATGDRMILLSSDDLLEPTALRTYAALASDLGARAERTVFGSTSYVVDSDGRRTSLRGIDWRLWEGATKDGELSAAAGADVWRMPAADLLRRSLTLLRSPYYFVTTCYPRALYVAVGGYGGGRLMNPDKAFAWKLLAVADEALVVDAPLFSYRVHASNQNAVQKSQGALKHLVDQYVATFDTPGPVLKAAGLKPDDLAAAFVEQDVALRGLMMLADGDRVGARRALKLGEAAYPALARANHKVAALRALLLLGPVGTVVARELRKRGPLRPPRRHAPIEP